MGKAIVFDGTEKFGKLTPIGSAGKTNRGQTLWKFSCECGNTHIATASSVKLGNCRSCGCLKTGTKTVFVAGNVYGSLTSIEDMGSNKNGSVIWKFRCICGKYRVTLATPVIRGDVVSCGCSIRTTFAAGDKFNLLTPIKAAGLSARGHVLWMFHCDCGKDRVIPASAVKSGQIKSCGCLRTHTYEESYFISVMGYPSRFFHIWKKNYSDGCPIDLFIRMSQDPCYYCGRVGINDYGGTRYNGLDRLSSSRDHSPDNIVTCCKTCNYMKREMEVEEFLTHIERIRSHLMDRSPQSADPDYRI